MKFCEVLKMLRNKSNMKQAQLANILNVANGTISQWENGSREPSLDMVLKVAQIFNITVDYLLTGENIKTEVVELKQLQKEVFQQQKEYYIHQKELFILQKQFYEDQEEQHINLQFYGRPHR